MVTVTAEKLMVEVAEDNKKKEQRREKGKEMQKSPNVGIEPTTSYSAAHVTTIELRLRVYNCYHKSHFLMM